MQLPTVFNASITSFPPLYTWPRFVKRVLLGLAIVAVLAAYMLLAGGMVAIVAVLTEIVTL